jgi:hypothetical protein
MEHTAIARDDCILDVLGRLERASRSLGRLKDILVIGSRLGVEPLGPDECFRELKALIVALGCALLRSPYCNDPLQTKNF